jgi:hypothetical protein
MTADALPRAVPVVAGGAYAGFLIRVARGIEAFDKDEVSIGIFETPIDAANAVCLCCGKGLADSVSMSGWIGPECSGGASANLPCIFKTSAAPLSFDGSER